MLNPIKILLVEDNPADVELVRVSLAEARILTDLIVAEDGEQGIALVEKERPDLVLLDLNLPKIHGREVLRFIKTHPVLRVIPVIILTGSSIDIEVTRSYGLGVNSYMVKPVDASQFLDLMTSFGHFWLNVVKLPSSELLKLHQEDVEGMHTKVAALKPQPRVLLSPSALILIEDSEADFELVRGMLSREMPAVNLVWAETMREGLAKLETGQFDAILLDLTLPDSLPSESLDTITQRFASVPLIVTTGREDMDFAIEAVRRGAQDYLLKGQFEAATLSRSIRYAIERKKIDQEHASALVSALEAKLEAEKAVWSRDEFLSIASHELKTPLTSLVLQTELIVSQLNQNGKTPPLPQLKRLLKTYDREIWRLRALITNLLDATQLGAGELAMTLEPSDLQKIIRVAIQSLAPILAEARCPISFESQGPLNGQWDSFRIDQVLTNLLSNASKYARGGLITVRLLKEGESAVIEVSDSGPGLSPQDLSRLFKRFERLPQTKNIAGLGLGLYITKQIVEAHGGTIYARSQPGHGTTFSIRLPIKGERKAPVPAPRVA